MTSFPPIQYVTKKSPPARWIVMRSTRGEQHIVAAFVAWFHLNWAPSVRIPTLCKRAVRKSWTVVKPYRSAFHASVASSCPDCRHAVQSRAQRMHARRGSR